jgi:hypothetical protein
VMRDRAGDGARSTMRSNESCAASQCSTPPRTCVLAVHHCTVGSSLGRDNVPSLSMDCTGKGGA